MRYTYLGRSGMQVSRLCLGTYNFGTVTTEEDAGRIMSAALEAGINFFDTANHYPDFVNCGRTEEIVGRWLAGSPERRRRVILATKVYQPMINPHDGPNDAAGLSKFKVRRHLDDSLRRLGTDHVELYQMHHIDRRTGWDEAWEAFETAAAQGKIDYVGSSNFPGWQLSLAQSAAARRNTLGLVSEQHMYNLLCRLPELEVVPACTALGIGLIPYSPMANGMLGGSGLTAKPGSRTSTRAAEIERRRPQLTAFAGLCRELGQRESIVALAWLLAQPVVSSVILGPRILEQFSGALAATEATLDAATLGRLDEIFPGPGGPGPEAYAW